MRKVLKLNIEVTLEVTTAEKKIKGRKRHVCTDTMGNLLYIKVGSAQESDTRIGPDVVYQTFRRYGSLLGICADQGYRGTTAQFVQEELKMRMDITEKPKDLPGFQVIKQRWVVERFFAWIGNFRRFSKDYEIHSFVSQQLISIAASVLLLKRIFN